MMSLKMINPFQKKNIRKDFLLAFFLIPVFDGLSQNYKLHSHNDYLRNVPFWEAYANGFESIEADIILLENELYVAHEKGSICKLYTLSSLYLDPIQKAFDLQLGETKPFQLLIDIKSEPYSTLEKLEEVLESYPSLYRSDRQHPFFSIVISGNRPAIQDYENYPLPILFDYQSVNEVSDLPLDKIALISLNFRNFSRWNGKGSITEKDMVKIKNAIGIAQSLNKPIRFWATPDGETAWKTLHELGVDFINTDSPFEAKNYFKKLGP